MNILIISDSSDKSILGTKIKDDLKNYLNANKHKVSCFNIQADDIHYCVGCFGCWLKTPGKCVFNDISSDMNKAYIESDIAIFLSPVKYGCYTPAIRRTLDRMLPNILPFFKKISGEVHHAPRYSKYPSFITYGYGEDITAQEAETFRSLSNANAINFQTDKAQIYINRKESEIKNTLTSLGNYLKECEM